MEEQASVILPCWQPPTTSTPFSPIIPPITNELFSSNNLIDNITLPINSTINRMRRHRLR